MYFWFKTSRHICDIPVGERCPIIVGREIELGIRQHRNVFKIKFIQQSSELLFFYI